MWDGSVDPLVEKMFELEKTNPDYEYRIGWDEIRKRKKGKALAIYHEFIKGCDCLARENNNSLREQYHYYYKRKRAVLKEYRKYLKFKPSSDEDKFIKTCYWYEKRIMLYACRSEKYTAMDINTRDYEIARNYRIKASSYEWALDELINNYDEYLNKKKNFKNPISGNIVYYKNIMVTDSVNPELKEIDAPISTVLNNTSEEISSVPNLELAVNNLHENLKKKEKKYTRKIK